MNTKITFENYLTDANVSSQKLNRLGEITSKFNKHLNNDDLWVTAKSSKMDLTTSTVTVATSDLTINMNHKFVEEHHDFSLDQAKVVAEEFVVYLNDFNLR